MDRKQLSGQVQQLHAYAAEANLLRVQDDAGDAPRAYARVQRVELTDKIRDALKKLDKGVSDPALDPALRQAQLLATLLVPAARTSDPSLVDLEQRLAVLDEVLRP